jgi:hypothetical protein
MCVVVDLKFEQKIPPGSASSSSKTRWKFWTDDSLGLSHISG